MAGLDDFTRTTEQLHVMQVEYEEQFGDPIVHLWCRTRSGDRRWVEVESFTPKFYIHQDAFSKRIVNHDWVQSVDAGTTSLYGEDLVEIETRLPWHVGGKQDKKGLREYFDRTWEADVFFTSRFLIDTGIKTHLEVDKDATWDGQSVSGDYRVGVDDIDPVEDPSWRATPRVITADIEVLSPDGFPNPDDAEQPVTAITAHDNHTDDYTVWVLRYEGWAYSDTEIQNIAVEERPEGADVAEVRVYEDEGAMLHHFNEWVEEREADLLSGWNSSTTDNGHPFDYPYIINRCKSKNVMNYRDWSPLGQVWDGNWGPGGKGVGFFDMLKGYKKAQWQKPKGGYLLDNIASKELDYGKEDIEDIDTAWRDDVSTFLKYNMRDVSATVGINESAEVIDLFQNIRSLVGVQFENCHNNIDLLDVFILRYAHEMGVALPTNEQPDRGWYYGAHVFDPTIGRHPNVVYPDLWSMYPNMIRNVNMSPETLIGTAEDLDASEYTEEDCRWTYIDTRQTNVKESDSPRYEKLYFLDPEIEEGFMTRVVDDLMGLKDHYDGTPLYDAVKRIVNSVYGVYGDSDSYGKGYRLFDWRIAEGITLGGRKMIQDSADQFIDAVNDIKHERGLDGNKAYLVGGDSVPANEPTLIRRDGDVEIVSVEDVTADDDVWTDNGWSGVKNVIKKPNRKQLYTVWTKHGITHVTEDHGLIRDSGEEVTPTAVETGEALLHNDVANVEVPGMEMEEQRAWLLGLFAAEGSCGIYGCESGAKASWAINNQDRELLEHAQEILSNAFGVQTKIDDVMESSNTLKLRLDKCGDNASVVLGFREMLYDGTEKCVPKEILNGSEGVQRAFVAGHHAGDGHIAHEHKEFDELWTKHKHLGAGLTFLLRQLGHTVSMHVRTEQSDEFYRIRSVAFTQGNDDEILGVEKHEYDGDYVYDLETENHHFQSGVGSMIVHNTDSIMTAMPFSENDEQCVEIALAAAERVNEWYDEWTTETFNLKGEHYCELEIESYAPWCFVPEGKTKDKAKKRYAEIVSWEEGEWFDPPEGATDSQESSDSDSGPVQGKFSITGMDVVRSDRAVVTREMVQSVVEDILRIDDCDAARNAVYDTISDVVERIENGDAPNSYIARPKGMGQHPSKYGSPDRRPQPTYRGAKYANKHFDWEQLGEGSKPQLLYIETVRGDWPVYYDAETAEDGDEVDAVAVEHPDEVPDEFVVDTEVMIDKVLRDPLEPILGAMRWSFEDAISDTEQASVSQFM